MEHDRVSFRWKDYADHHRAKVMTVSAEEFLRRLLLHVLPKGFVRIRHFGLLASVNVATKLQHCRQLLGQETPSAPHPAKSCIERVWEWTGQDPRRCSRCHGFLERRPLLESLPEAAQPSEMMVATHRQADEAGAAAGPAGWRSQDDDRFPARLRERTGRLAGAAEQASPGRYPSRRRCRATPR